MSTPGSFPGPGADLDFLADRINTLRQLLTDEDPMMVDQRKNIAALLDYYTRGGKFPEPGQTLWVVNGNLQTEEPSYAASPVVWMEKVQGHRDFGGRQIRGWRR